MSKSSFPYQTKKVDFDLEGLKVSILRVTNVSELMDAFIDRDPDDEDVKDERFPYWADLWHSAIGLGRYLSREGIVQPGMTVTEMGCGLGFSGITAGLLGAEVTFTDYLPEALDFAKQNWELNTQKKANFQLMDWRKPNINLAADLILAADVAYEVRSFEPLLKSFETLCKPQGQILISEPNRKITKPFLDALEKSVFSVSHHIEKVFLDEVTAKVNILRLERKQE